MQSHAFLSEAEILKLQNVGSYISHNATWEYLLLDFPWLVNALVAKTGFQWIMCGLQTQAELTLMTSSGLFSQTSEGSLQKTNNTAGLHTE